MKSRGIEELHGEGTPGYATEKGERGLYPAIGALKEYIGIEVIIK